MEYKLNKGVGQDVELFGLKAQYLYLFAGGLLAVEDGCILSKDADVTVGFKIRLPEVFTLTSADYEAMHGA